MKKIFTLIASAVMAFSVSAQEKEWNISNFEVGDFTEETTIDGLTIYATDKGKVSIDANNKTVDGVKYTKRLKTGGAGSYADGVYSRVISFDIPSNGTVTFIGTSSNSSDARVVGVSFGEFIAFPAEGDLPAGLTAIDVDPGNPQVKTVDYTGGTATKVFIYSKSGGVNFVDFKFTPAEGGDTPEPVEGELSISPVAINPSYGTTFDAYKGSITCDGKVMEVSNFPFSGAKFSLDLVIRDGQQGSTRPIYNLVPKAGFTVKGEIDNYGSVEKLYAIDNQPDELVMTLDGANSVKFVDYTFMFGTSTSAQFIPSETGAPYYETVILYLVGKYQQFADGAWGEVKNYGYINFQVNVPINGPTSSIDEVAVDFDENAPVEYYNLQGVRVAEPSNGVFIKRQGNKVVKVLVK